MGLLSYFLFLARTTLRLRLDVLELNAGEVSHRENRKNMICVAPQLTIPLMEVWLRTFYRDS